jgi:hypothetical protein
VLRSGEGKRAQVSAEVDMSVLTLHRWRRRYHDKVVYGRLKDATRPSRRYRARVPCSANDKQKKAVDRKRQLLCRCASRTIVDKEWRID